MWECKAIVSGRSQEEATVVCGTDHQEELLAIFELVASEGIDDCLARPWVCGGGQMAAIQLLWLIGGAGFVVVRVGVRRSNGVSSSHRFREGGREGGRVEG